MTTPTLIEAARAVVARWDSPKWADAAHTRDYIDRLRAAIKAAESAKPAAWITRESMMRLSNGGNDSRGTVPVHPRASAIANRPLYLHPPEPARQPMTELEIIGGFEVLPEALTFFTAFEAGVRHAERHHRIGSEETTR